MTEVARTNSARFNIGRWCAFIAAVMWFGREGPMVFFSKMPDGGVSGMVYLLVLFGLAVRAGNDALVWLFAAHNALSEKREFEAKGLSAAIQWAHAKEVNDAMNGNYKGDPEGVAKIVRALEEKYGKA